jgi:hypothetical protein
VRVVDLDHPGEGKVIYTTKQRLVGMAYLRA